mmetsp:Transcript_15959/g.19419  ORF Transcript_15959/g.19419 Transcript_15959/m.19419 type:complete len:420 (+) Transcript_15959:495-1754(+)
MTTMMLRHRMLTKNKSNIMTPINNNIDYSSSKGKWDKWGTRGYSVMPHVSPESKRIAETYQLRPMDVVILSFPKTGTTWTQTVCEMLRTNAEGYDGFNDIAERQPWLEFAYDCGQDLDCYDDDHIQSSPRIFKSHQLLSAINPGAKYLCIVRDPDVTLLSWFAFQKAKGRPGYAEYNDANEFIANRPELFGGKCCFGTNIWEMYAEVWLARNDPSVKTLVYEALVADGPNGYMDHLPIIADFLGLKNYSNIEEENKNNEEETKQLYEKVAFLVSREQMVQHVDKFDDHFITEMGSKYGRALRIMEPAAKVRRKSQTSKRAELNETTIEWLEDQWFERMTPVTGHATYDEFATDLSELLFTDVDVVEDILEEEKESIGVHVLGEQKQSKKSSIVMRRQSSISVCQMPGIRRRRESLAPHE